MTRSLRLCWPQLDITVTAKLLDDLNPILAEDLWQATPLLSIQSHAMVAGEQIYFPTRLVLDDPGTAFTEPMDQQPPGRINFEPYFQYVSLNYGPMTEPVPAWPIAQVADADLGKLPQLGRDVWDGLMAARTDLLVVVEQADAEPIDIDSSTLQPYASATELPVDIRWQALLEHIERDTTAIWAREPEDVQALRLGVQTSDAGVNGQYFSPWVMVTGLVRSLAIVELASIERLCRNPAFTLPQLQILLHEQLTVQLGVISYFGLPQLGATLAAVDRCIDQIDTQNDFTHFIQALLTYVNRYNLWLYQTFPWRLGDQFPKADLATAQRMLDLSTRGPYMRHPARLDTR